MFRRLDDYVDRELSAADVELVEKHLAECEACAMEYGFETSFVREVKEKLRKIEVSPDLRQRIAKALRDLPPSGGG
jgi:anti-sigma factor (TIGR02949 family)